MRYLLLVLIGLCTSSADAEQAYLHGIPFAKATLTAESAKLVGLSEKERLSSILSIGITPSQEYVWSSREGKPLVRIDGGAYMHFIAPTSGWIKIVRMEDLLMPGSLSKATQELQMGIHFIPKEKRNANYIYFEVLTQGLMLMVYYGTADVVSQPGQ